MKMGFEKLDSNKIISYKKRNRKIHKNILHQLVYDKGMTVKDAFKKTKISKNYIYNLSDNNQDNACTKKKANEIIIALRFSGIKTDIDTLFYKIQD